jgi:hypothetical protein
MKSVRSDSEFRNKSSFTLTKTNSYANSLYITCRAHASVLVREVERLARPIESVKLDVVEIDMQTPDALMGLAFGIPTYAGDEVSKENGHRWDPMDCDEKAPPPARTALRMECDFSYLPDHDEDAHFCHAGAGVVGVADGVGGCRGDGVDAAEFSRGLMANAYNTVTVASSSGI